MENVLLLSPFLPYLAMSTSSLRAASRFARIGP